MGLPQCGCHKGGRLEVMLGEHGSVARRRNVGLLLALMGVLAVASDGMLLKLAFRGGASPASAAILKYSSSGITMCVVLGMLAATDRERAARMDKTPLPLLPWPSPVGWRYVLASAVLNVLLEMCYSLGFAFTTSANVLAFASLAPVWAAFMSWPALGVRVPRRTMVACVFALAGSIVIGFGFAGIGTGGDAGVIASLGLAFAIGTGICAAAQLTLIQSAAINAPETNMLIAHGLGVSLTALTGCALLPVLHPPGTPILPGRLALFYLILDGVIGSALAISALTLAVAYIPATEVSLLLQFEGLLGPLSTYLALNEIPTLYTLIGGGVVICVVIIHEALAFAEEIRAGRAEAAARAAAPAGAVAVDFEIRGAAGGGARGSNMVAAAS